MARITLDVFKKKFEFGWDVLDGIISGGSSIDAKQGLGITSRPVAEDFTRAYGYEPSNPIEQAELLGNFHEAIHFIRRSFLKPDNPDGIASAVPRKILEITDVTDLFLLASDSLPNQDKDPNGALYRDWACCILKVMHTIAHIDKDMRNPYFSEIQKQILDRFYKYVHRGADGVLSLGVREDDSLRVQLVSFESKPKKTRDSNLIKLLHKSENVAEDIYDQVGVRFVTRTRLDAVRVVKFLRDQNILIAPNIKPSRSRNTLVDTQALKEEVQRLISSGAWTSMNDIDFDQTLDDVAHLQRVNRDGNPHTSLHYRAIQFTARQLIKVVNPIYEDVRELKAVARQKPLPEEAAKILERMNLRYSQRDIRFFYPFEVQITDQKSAQENEAGLSSHVEYKRSQVATAMKRVMGSLTDANQR